MKNFALALLVLVCASTSAFATDVPSYRAVFTGVGRNPTVSVSAVAGDALVVFGIADAYSSTDVSLFSISDDDGGTYWDQYCISAWRHPNNKWAKVQTQVRGQLAASTGTLHVSVNTNNKTAAIAVVAISGLTLVNNYPPFNGCGTLNPGNGTPGSVRQIKDNFAPGYQFIAGELPTVPKFGQQSAFLSTSLTIAIVANEQNVPSPTAPSGWTQRTSVGGSAFGMSISTLDSGFSGQSVTWGSTTPTPGNALVLEFQPIQ